MFEYWYCIKCDGRVNLVSKGLQPGNFEVWGYVCSNPECYYYDEFFAVPLIKGIK